MSYQLGRVSRVDRGNLYHVIARLSNLASRSDGWTEGDEQSSVVLLDSLREVLTGRCECEDSGCRGDHKDAGRCAHKASSWVRRTDMEDGTTRFRFCEVCAEDAYESGVFA